MKCGDKLVNLAIGVKMLKYEAYIYIPYILLIMFLSTTMSLIFNVLDMLKFCHQQPYGIKCEAEILEKLRQNQTDQKQNMALNKNATQSSKRSVNDPWSADKAVDGNRNNAVSQNSCTHTSPNKTTAWWQVDLEQSVRIDHIYLVYRATYEHRLAGFTLLISNGTDWNNSEVCFNHSSESLPPTTTNISCEYTGRYVTMYNERIGTFPSAYSPFAFIELCELEVYGCPEFKFGIECDKTCHCGCNPNTGKCYSSTCNAGWRGENCNDVCKFQTFGDQCKHQCLCQAGSCHHVTGVCDNEGCQYGWTGPNCTTACVNNTFGPDCAEICHCLDGGCDRFNGTCLQSSGLCQPGWAGRTCGKKCKDKTFGSNCSGTCGACYGETTCNHVTGMCESGCKFGFREPYCNDCSSGKYGHTCDKTCGDCQQCTDVQAIQQTTNIPAVALGCSSGILLVSQIVTCGLLIRLRRASNGNIEKNSGTSKTGNVYTNTTFNEEDKTYYDEIQHGTTSENTQPHD